MSAILDVVLKLPRKIVRVCNSTVESRLENAINVEFDLEKADHASLQWIMRKGLMLVAGEVMRATTKLTEKGKPNKDYDPDVEALLDFTREKVLETKYLAVDCDKYVAWKTSNRRAAKTQADKDLERNKGLAAKLQIAQPNLSEDDALKLAEGLYSGNIDATQIKASKKQ